MIYRHSLLYISRSASQLMVKVLGLIPLLLVFSSPLIAQQNYSIDKAEWSSIHQKAHNFMDHSEYDSARVYLIRASEAYDRQNASTQYVIALTQLGSVYRTLGEYKEAKNTLTQALEYEEAHGITSIEYATTLNTKAGVHLDLDEYDYVEDLLTKALEYLNAQEDPNKYELASTYHHLGSLNSARGHYDKSLKDLNKADEILSSLSEPDYELLAAIYNDIGITYYHKGQLYKTAELFEKAADMVRKENGEYHPDVAGYYNNIGIVYKSLGDFQEASKFLKKALDIQRSLFGDMHPDLARTYNSLSSVYRRLGEEEQALTYLNKDLAITIQAKGQRHYEVAQTRFALAQLYKETGNYQKALNNVEQYLSIAANYFPNGHPDIIKARVVEFRIYMEQKEWDIAEKKIRETIALGESFPTQNQNRLVTVHYWLGQLYSNQQKYEQALPHYQDALKVSVPDFSPEEIMDNPELNREQYRKEIATVLYSKADALAISGQKMDDPDYRKAALKTFDLSIQVLDKLQQEYQSEESKLILGLRTHKIFEGAISACYDFYESTGDQRYIRKAYYYTEKGKSRVIRGQIIENEAKKYSDVPDSLLDKENQLREYITKLQKGLERAKSKNDSTKVGKYRNALFSVDEQLQSHIEMLEAKYPDYYRLKYQDQVVDADEFRASMLNEGQALVQYFKVDRDLYTFVLTSQEISINKRELKDSLKTQVNRFRNAIIKHQKDSVRELGYDLYANLIKPIDQELAGVDQILIVPDGYLYNLPFEALPTQRSGEDAAFRDLQYLIQDYQISYLPSATLHWQNRTNKQEQLVEQKFLAMAPVFNEWKGDNNSDTRFLRSDSITPLPMSRYEVQSIVKEFKKNEGFFSWVFGSVEPTIYLEREATESRLKSSQLEQYKYLHLATHAFIRKDKPNLSGIQLYKDEGSGEDGVLLASEVYNLSTNADLVVLSACETGLGEVMKGEGLIGFTQSFLYAGASNLMVSLWKVADRSTADSMIGFYDQLLDGNSYAASLRQVKLDMIQSGRYADPWYWSPFILIGR